MERVGEVLQLLVAEQEDAASFKSLFGCGTEQDHVAGFSQITENGEPDIADNEWTLLIAGEGYRLAGLGTLVDDFRLVRIVFEGDDSEVETLFEELSPWIDPWPAET